MIEAKLDGYRVYKIRERGRTPIGEIRSYIAPVYVIGLPGDVILLNKELKYEAAGEVSSSK